MWRGLYTRRGLFSEFYGIATPPGWDACPSERSDLSIGSPALKPVRTPRPPLNADIPFMYCRILAGGYPCCMMAGRVVA